MTNLLARKNTSVAWSFASPEMLKKRGASLQTEGQSHFGSDVRGLERTCGERVLAWADVLVGCSRDRARERRVL